MLSFSLRWNFLLNSIFVWSSSSPFSTTKKNLRSSRIFTIIFNRSNILSGKNQTKNKQTKKKTRNLSSPPTQNLPPTPPSPTPPSPTQPNPPATTGVPSHPGLAIFRQQLRHEIHRGTGGPGEADDHEDHLPVAGWEVEMWFNGWIFTVPSQVPPPPPKKKTGRNKRKKGTKLLGLFLVWDVATRCDMMIYRNYFFGCWKTKTKGNCEVLRDFVRKKLGV